MCIHQYTAGNRDTGCLGKVSHTCVFDSYSQGNLLLQISNTCPIFNPHKIKALYKLQYRTRLLLIFSKRSSLYNFDGKYCKKRGGLDGPNKNDELKLTSDPAKAVWLVL